MKSFAAALLSLAVLITGPAPASAQRRPERARPQLDQPQLPVRPRRPAPPPPPVDTAAHSMDGSGNNLDDLLMGAVGTVLIRVTVADYGDGVSALAGENRPSARHVSNAVADQEESIPNHHHASDYLWQWGQFLDHDIDLTGAGDPAESADIDVPAGDPFFDPLGTGTQVIAFTRSAYDHSTGTAADAPRQQLNQITAWIDASNVYGSDAERAAALRTNDGTGRLKTSAGDLLPFNEQGLVNAGGPSAALFVAGDVRANEQVGLTAMHTLFVREHNRQARLYARLHPEWSGDQIYDKARQMVGAEMQAITYREFLPALLGPGALRPYRGYQPAVDASIANEFSTAAYRFGHSALSPTLLRLDAGGEEIAQGSLALRDAFFSPSRIIDEGGIEPILRGLARQRCQRVDPLVIDDVRNFLFGAPGQGGIDLASLNIQRGRDHGLPGFNAMRAALGFEPADDFDDVSSDPEIQLRLADAYETVDTIDAWVGGLAEDPVSGSHLGPLFHSIVADQFERLRDGDRFWYERTLSPTERRAVDRTRLADIIRRNTDIGLELQPDVFHVPR